MIKNNCLAGSYRFFRRHEKDLGSIAGYGGNPARDGVVAVPDLARGFNGAFGTGYDPVDMACGKAGGFKLIPGPDNDLFSIRIDTQHVKGMGMGDSKPFPLANGIAVCTVVTSQNFSVTVHYIPGKSGQIFLSLVLFKETDIIIIGDEADFLAFSLFSYTKAVV
jgi:hypothetical protein